MILNQQIFKICRNINKKLKNVVKIHTFLFTNWDSRATLSVEIL